MLQEEGVWKAGRKAAGWRLQAWTLMSASPSSLALSSLPLAVISVEMKPKSFKGRDQAVQCMLSSRTAGQKDAWGLGGSHFLSQNRSVKWVHTISKDPEDTDAVA